MLSVPPVMHNAVLSRSTRPYVLLVDDHEPSLRKLSQIVEDAGFDCAIACSARQAVEHCDERRPQVVVTDLAMPNLDGCGLASWLSLRLPSVPLLLMTGQALDDPELASLRRSFIAVLPKPVDVDWLLSWIERLMPDSRFANPPLTEEPQ